MTACRIMFVDDETDFLSAIARGLRKEPYEVVTASSGEEALQKMRSGKFDLVVSDYRMPEMDGLALLRKIQRDHRQTKTVMISAVADIHVAIEAMNNLEVSKFFLKPIDLDQLKPVLREVLREKGKSNRPAPAIHSAPIHGANLGQESEIGSSPDYWRAYYKGPVVQCPFCREGICFRVHREPWMKLIPLLMRMQCRTCFRTFLKLGRG